MLDGKDILLALMLGAVWPLVGGCSGSDSPAAGAGGGGSPSATTASGTADSATTTSSANAGSGGASGAGGSGSGAGSGGGGSSFDPTSCGAPDKPILDLNGMSIAGVRSCTGIVYDPVVNLPEVRLDMYVPPAYQSGHRSPAIIYIHGGGWRAGDKNEVNPHQLDYLARGYFVFSLDYRLSAAGQTQHPVDMTTGAPPANATAIQDVKTAIQFIRGQYGGFVDTDNLVAWGFSAGAHLAVLSGVSANDETDHPAIKGRSPGGESSAVKAVVAQSAVFDFDLFAASPMPRCGELATQDPSVCGTPAHPIPGKCTTDPQCTGQACVFGDEYVGASRPAATAMIGSPITTPATGVTAAVTPFVYVDAQDPPMYLLSGKCDATVPTAGASGFAPAARDKGADVTLVLVETAGHKQTLDQSTNPTGDADVEAWILSKGLPASVP